MLHLIIKLHKKHLQPKLLQNFLVMFVINSKSVFYMAPDQVL